MTPAEQIEYLITKVLGWRLLCGNCKGKGLVPYIHGDAIKKCEDCDGFTDYEYSESWNPLTSWDHWRSVEEKVMDSGVMG